MLAKYFRFQEEPFGATPDPRWLYRSTKHREALASLRYGYLSNRGFTALIAPPGLGKTTLLFQFLHDIRSSARIVFLFDTQCDPLGLLRYILRDLGVTPAANSDEMHVQLESVLIAESRAQRTVVIVVDEAQNLSDDALEMLRLLTNYETPRAKMLHIVLSGQPPLADNLMKPSMEQLAQRVSTNCWLEPFSVEETTAYIRHRLEQAGYRGAPLFRKDALRRIMFASHGIPRLINNLCFNALELCREQKRQQVDYKMALEAIAIQELDPEARKKITDRWLASGEPARLPETPRNFEQLLQPVTPLQPEIAVAMQKANDTEQPAEQPIASELHLNQPPQLPQPRHLLQPAKPIPPELLLRPEKPIIDEQPSQTAQPRLMLQSVPPIPPELLLRPEKPAQPAIVPPPQQTSEAAESIPSEQPAPLSLQAAEPLLQVDQPAQPAEPIQAEAPVESFQQEESFESFPPFEEFDPYAEPEPMAPATEPVLAEQRSVVFRRLVVPAAAVLLASSGIGLVSVLARNTRPAILTPLTDTPTALHTQSSQPQSSTIAAAPVSTPTLLASADQPASIPPPAATNLAAATATARIKPSPARVLALHPAEASSTRIPIAEPAYAPAPTDAKSAASLPLSTTASAGSASIDIAAPSSQAVPFQITAGRNQSIRDICVRFLGVWDQKRLHEIQALNPSLADLDHIPAGEKIWLPAPAPAPIAPQLHPGQASNGSAVHPAVAAAIHNPLAGTHDAANMPRKEVGATGIGSAASSGVNVKVNGKVAPASLPAINGTASAGSYGKVASANILATVKETTPSKRAAAPPTQTLSSIDEQSNPANQ